MLYFFCTLLWVMPVILFGQGDHALSGARSAAMGSVASTLSDHWSVVNNISGITAVKNLTTGASFENKFGLSNLNSALLVLVSPFKKISVAGSVYRFGDDAYNELLLGMGAAHKIRNVSLGVKINYFQIGMSEGATKQAYIFEFGGQAEITPHLTFGASIFNINQASIKISGSNFYLPVYMRAGLSYKPHEKLIINAETFKDILFPASFRAGVEYVPITKLKLRSGLMTQPVTACFGIGFKGGHYGIDYAFRIHQVLGDIHQLSLTYFFISTK